jgi:hypothetical protein
LAALAFGAALASVPAFAQQGQQPSAPSYGRAANDGGTVTPSQQAGARSYYDVVPQNKKPSTTPLYGRAPNDGGTVTSGQ